MKSLKSFLITVIDAIYSFGFGLVTSSVIYFIIGSVAEIVHGKMLEWTFCGSVSYLFGPDWCGAQIEGGSPWFNHFIHRLLNSTIPWFMMFWGIALICLCSLLLKIVGQHNRRLHDRA